MPTKRPRHMITETDEVELALAPLRARGAKIDLGRLVVLGAQAQMAEIEREWEDRAARVARQDEALRRMRESCDLDVLMSDEAWR